MRLASFLAFIFAFNLGYCQDRNVNSENVIQWQEAYKLQVADFQKVRSENDSYSFSAFKIEFYPSEVLTDRNDYIQGYKDVTVVAEFHMDKSHFHPDYETELLEREQIIFDIAEVYARKIRKRFEELKSSKEKRFSIYNYEYRLLWNACLDYKSDFNTATNSGWESDEAMAIWRKQVTDELETLKDYQIKPL